jgi:twinkle protein
MTDAGFLRHEPCPECGSSDALARYEDGHAHCFAYGCSYRERSDGKPRKPAGGKPISSKSLISLEEQDIQPLKKRHLTQETCEKFGYATSEFKGRPCQIANYRRGGKVVAQKVRLPDKSFLFLGSAKEAGLYGQHLWREGGRKLIITEGEIDALSVSQLQSNKWPVVSVPTGAKGAAKSIAKEIEWVDSFEEVVFAFDMDEPGQEAAKECAALLTPGKAKIAYLPAKDANDALQNGKGKQLISSLWEAKPYRPDGVVDVASVIDDAAKPIQFGNPWPWPTLTGVTYGRRRKELYGFGGGTGCGKSTVFKLIALHVIEEEDLPVGLIFLEEPPAHTLKTMAGMKVGKRFHVPGVEYDESEIREALEEFKNRVFLYDHFGSSGWENIKDKIRYMVRALGVRDIFLDHLTALAASIDTDERKAIDKIMAELAALTQELDCTIYYVSHLSTPEGKPHEEGGRVMEKHFRGSRSIAYWSHFLFGIERNKQDTEGVITFRVLKDRYTGDAAGVTFGLCYERETGRLNECALPEEGGKEEEVPWDDAEF